MMVSNAKELIWAVGKRVDITNKKPNLGYFTSKKKEGNESNQRKLDHNHFDTSVAIKVTNIVDGAALIRAARENNLKAVKRLVGQGADVQTKDNCPLQWASRNGNLAMVEYLVEQGANVQARDGLALMEASLGGYSKVVKFLKKAQRDQSDCMLQSV